VSLLISANLDELHFSKYDRLIGAAKDLLWEKLANQIVGEWLEIWLKTLNFYTALNYRTGMKRLAKIGLFQPELSLQAFALINHDAIIDRIKKDSFEVNWSECTRQARAACYISFTSFLSRRFQGMIKKATPSKEGSSKTFFQVHHKVVSSAMTQSQWLLFLEKLSRINLRDCLIARLSLQGGKRIGEVLSLNTDQINWEQNQIRFFQSKTKGVIKETTITYATSILYDLRLYVNGRKGVVFITRSGKKVPRIQLASTFARAGIHANIPFRVTPHILRASTVTFLKQQGFPDSEIMKVTGHASSEMIYAYDKTSNAENASKRINLAT
jgi:integrase/recombinase XerD